MAISTKHLYPPQESQEICEIFYMYNLPFPSPPPPPPPQVEDKDGPPPTPQLVRHHTIGIYNRPCEIALVNNNKGTGVELLVDGKGYETSLYYYQDEYGQFFKIYATNTVSLTGVIINTYYKYHLQLKPLDPLNLHASG
jgi:hypothetical protein